MAQNLLIDTSVILEGGKEIIAKLEKIAPVFVTDIVLQELDGHKNNANGSVAYRAREFFRKLGNSNGISLDVLPLSAMRLEKTDTLRKMFLGSTPLHVIVRKPYKSRDINDSKIIEVAKDYNMTLVTLDTAQRVRGLSDGVNAVTLEAILPQENIIERKEVMSEIEKIEDTQEKNNTNKKNTIKRFIVISIIVSIFGSIILSYVATEAIFWYFMLGCFIVVSSLINLLLRKKRTSFISDNSKSNSTFETFTEPIYSNMLGNIYHKN